MNVLLSAYACEPNRGSEPGIGWNWATEISKRGHNLWVLTRSNNKSVIEETDYDRAAISFIYYDLPKLLLRSKRYMGVNIYYILWQIGVAFHVSKNYKHLQFDLVHHLTFGVFRNISYLIFFIKAPFVFGPVGGGEAAPYPLRKSFEWKFWFKDFLRDIINIITFYSPLYRYFISRTDLILCKTKDTQKFIPRKHKVKSKVELEIGIKEIEPRNNTGTNTKTVLFVARFIYLKGAHFVLRAFSNVQKELPDAKIIMVGEGYELNNLLKIEKELAIKNIEWVPWLTQEQLKLHYRNSDVMLFPSLHDSSGNVVLEALSHGLPVICLDLGGPPEIVGTSMDTIVASAGCDEGQIVDRLSVKLMEVLKNETLLANLKKEAYTRATDFVWNKSVDRVYKNIEQELVKP